MRKRLRMVRQRVTQWYSGTPTDICIHVVMLVDSIPGFLIDSLPINDFVITHDPQPCTFPFPTTVAVSAWVANALCLIGSVALMQSLPPGIRWTALNSVSSVPILPLCAVI